MMDKKKGQSPQEPDIWDSWRFLGHALVSPFKRTSLKLRMLLWHSVSWPSGFCRLLWAIHLIRERNADGITILPRGESCIPVPQSQRGRSSAPGLCYLVFSVFRRGIIMGLLQGTDWETQPLCSRWNLPQDLKILGETIEELHLPAGTLKWEATWVQWWCKQDTRQTNQRGLGREIKLYLPRATIKEEKI